jgi:hypothetical protein
MTADIKVLLFTDPDQTFDDVTTPTLVFHTDPERGDGWTLFYRDHSGKVRRWFVGGEPGQLEWARQLAGDWFERTD